MWSAIAPPFFWHVALSRVSSAATSASSSAVIGKAKGGKTEKDSSRDRKHSNGELLMMPRGSNPTRSKRARTSSLKRNGPAPSTKSTPDPPGPPGLRKIEPILAAGSVAGSRTSDSEICVPPGTS